MRRSPRDFKILAVLGIAVALWIILGFEKGDTTSDAVDIDYRRLIEANGTGAHSLEHTAFAPLWISGRNTHDADYLFTFFERWGDPTQS